MKIFGLDTQKLRYAEFIEEIQEFITRPVSGDRSHGKIIFTPNPEICLETLSDTDFLHTLKQADYLTSDGIGLYLAYQIIDTSLPKIFLVLLFPYFVFNILFRKKYLFELYGDRICGSDLTSELIHFSEKNNIKVAIVDPYFPQDRAKCESQNNFEKHLQQLFPELAFDYYILRADNRSQILENIKNSDAKICFATLGMKKQELFCLEVREKCLNIRLALGVGSSFDYYTGFQKRAPKIWRDLGFEWLYRIFTSPNKIKRLKRICNALIVFPLKVLLYEK